MTRLSSVCALTLPLAFFAQSVLADTFVQTNLVTDGCATCPTAANVDPNLKDPWGLAFSATSPFWVSDRDAGVSTLYNGAGAAQGGPLIVTVPPGTASTGPTGQVFAGPTTSFLLNGASVSFIFDTLGGTIDAWNGGAGTKAVVMATTPGANYTGLALANNTLYAANFVSGGGINVFNSSFAATTLSGKFVDPNLPAGYAPFNIQNLNGTLYVEYAQVTAGVPVSLSGGGYVDEFDTNGNFIKRLSGNAAGAGPLNAPWGVAVVPGTGYGAFAAGDVLIGNFFSGDIDVFDANGNFLQTLKDANGNTLINAGLWAIAFDAGQGDAGGLYFTAGINQGNDGIFGKIDAVPEPAAWGLAVLGLLGLGVIRRRSFKR